MSRGQHTTTQPTGSLVIASITRPQGLRGHVRIRVDFDDPELFQPGQETELVLGDSSKNGRRSKKTAIESCRFQHGRWIAKFEALQSIDDAVDWVGASVCIPREALSETGEGEYFSFDLEGCAVYHGEEPIGIVDKVLEAGGGTMLQLVRSGNEVLVPFVKEYVKGVDVREKRIDVELPEGLADLND